MYYAVQDKEHRSSYGKTAILAVNQHIVFSHLLPGHFLKEGGDGEVKRGWSWLGDQRYFLL